MPPPNRAVVDASVGVKWLVPEVDDDRASALAGARLFVPELFYAECANALWSKARRGTLERADALEALARLKTVSLVRVTHDQLIERALELSLELIHPVYDCLYLALAIKEAIPVVTADTRFISAAAGHRSYASRIVPLSSIPLE
jgi:predicted nucleic acid-binding protein